jgi:uncharacterized protein YdaU (DUF1376 family)
MSILHVAFYPSDWLAGTRGLSDAETGVYITLIARMYEMAGPIERDDNRLSRLCGCKTKNSFVKALDYLISDGKIIEGENGLFNERVQKEIEKATEKSSKAKAAAQSRWERKPNKNNGGDNADASGKHMPPPCQLEPELDIEEDTNVSLSVSTDEAIHANDVSEAVSAYNVAAKHAGWPKVQKMSAARTKSLKARLKECGGIDGWKDALNRAYASDFVRNQWSGFGFDSLISQQKFTRLMEGNYDNRTRKPANTSDRPGNGVDPALEQIARLAGLD